MTDYTAFDPESGLALVVMQMPSREDAELNTPPGAVLLEGRFPTAEFYLADGEPTRFPEKPGDWAEWDHVERAWIDPRDPAEEMALRRASASMTRSDFLLAAIRAGVIQPSDAGPAARGEIPPSLSPVFDALPPEVQVEAVVRWGAATMIDRTNPVLAVLAEAMTVTDAQLDALFGI